MEVNLKAFIVTEKEGPEVTEKVIFKGGDDDATWTLTIEGAEAAAGFCVGQPYEVSIRALQKKLTD